MSPLCILRGNHRCVKTEGAPDMLLRASSLSHTLTQDNVSAETTQQSHHPKGLKIGRVEIFKFGCGDDRIQKSCRLAWEQLRIEKLLEHPSSSVRPRSRCCAESGWARPIESRVNVSHDPERRHDHLSVVALLHCKQ